MGSLANMILNDLSSFELLTDDIKEKTITAATNMVNIMAAMTRKKAMANIQRDLTLRNDFTLKQIQYTQMKHGARNLSEVQAMVGATEKVSFMERQELGGKHEPLKGNNLAIPSLAARGGNLGVLVQTKYRVSNLYNLKVRGPFKAKTGTHKSRQVARAAVAFETGKVIHYGEKLFFIDNFVARGGKVSLTKRQLYDFSKQFTITPPTHWLSNAFDEVMLEGSGIFESQMQKVGL